jgi:dihydrofolate reductase
MITTHVYVGTSLDGFIAREDGDFDWLSKFADQAAVESYKEFIAGIDVIVIGRGTFETILGFPDWPYDRPAIVVSRSLREIPPNLAGNVTLSSLQPRELLNELGEAGFRSAYIDGGKLIQSFLADDLIDELIIARVPVLIGNGIPLFGFLSRDLEFEHRRTVTFPNGLVRSYYMRPDAISRRNVNDI